MIYFILIQILSIIHPTASNNSGGLDSRLWIQTLERPWPKTFGLFVVTLVSEIIMFSYVFILTMTDIFADYFPILALKLPKSSTKLVQISFQQVLK